MRFEHAHPRAKGVVETITARLDPEHHPDDREIEKENQMRHPGVGEGDCDDRGAAVTAQFVVVSSRVRQIMMRPSSPR